MYNNDAVRATARGAQFLDYAFYLLYTLLGIRLVLALIGAGSGNAFVRFIVSLTDPFFAPFRGIVGSPTTSSGNTLAFPIVIALVAYVILHIALTALLRTLARRRTTI